MISTGLSAALFAAILILPVLAHDPETGVASWYGHPFHGRTAASGEVYDMETLTAAHPTLPFNTRVRIVNLENKKSVEVRIIDRGPFIDGRIVDLSHAAARALGMIQPGTVAVRLEVIGARHTGKPVPGPAPPPSPAGRYAVQVGAFRDRDSAEGLRARVEKQYGSALLVPRESDPAIWRVWVGAESTEQAARTLCARLREAGETDAFLTGEALVQNAR